MPTSGTVFPNPLVQDPQNQQNFDAIARRFAEVDLTLAELTVGTPPSGPAGGSLDGTYPNPGLAATVAGAALTETANVLDVAVDGSSIEVSGDALRVKAGGITNAMLAGSIAYSKLTLTGSVVTGDLAFDVATQAELDAHINDTSDAHDASAISITAIGGIAATDVQGALAEDVGDLAAHLADTSAAHAASAVSFSPAGSIAATDVQAAIVEAASEASPSFPLLAPDGSTAAPSYSFTNDPDTGMYSGSTNLLCFAAGGTEVLRLFTGTTTIGLSVAGDTDSKHLLNLSNASNDIVGIGFGNGAAGSNDTYLYRRVAATLKTDGALEVAGATTATGGVASAGGITESNSAGLILSANGGKDTLALSNTTADVGLTIGADTNLYRSAANTLKTDDSLIVAGTASNVPKFEAVTGYKIIAGAVNSAGALSIGAGFTSAKDATGDYALTWSDDFSSTPLVMASCGSTASKTIAANPTTTGCDIRTFSADAATDTAFNFIALGPI